MAKRKDGKPRSMIAQIAMLQSGHCAYPSSDGSSHARCRRDGCTCACHKNDN